VHESLTDALRELHLPAMRREYESAAARARQESLSYERFLLDLAERECESRRSNSRPGVFLGKVAGFRLPRRNSL
jgi:hypothetical protein